MIKLKNKPKSNLLKLCVAFLFPFSLFGGIASMHESSALNKADYIQSYQEQVSVTNPSFNDGSGNSYISGNSLNGWNAIESSSQAKGMIIDVGTGTNTEDGGSTTVFSKNQSVYMLEQNPFTNGDDSKILMINSKSKESNKNVNAQKGFRSSSITLESNSFYSFKVSVKTATNGDNSVNASAYISGIKNDENKDIELSYTNIITPVWQECQFFVATGNKEQTVTLDLYLGAKDGRSSGAVFFDEVYVNKYSENLFYNLCYEYNYQNADSTQVEGNSQSCFLIDGLVSEKDLFDDSGYNFNFEDPITTDNTLNEAWSVSARDIDGHAEVVNMKTMQPVHFYEKTGYTFIGDDLSYLNEQSLLMYTKSNQSFVNVKSKDISIPAHNIYKISLKLKLAEISSGSFYLKVQENDKIYNLYPDLLSKDGENKYELQTGKTSGINSNVENKFTNSYQTVEFYLKGHSLYNSVVNLELCLGDKDVPAQGCVIVDDIQIAYAKNSDFENASNKLELVSLKSAPADFKNAYFDITETDKTKDIYPLPASNWTAVNENNKNKQGVLFLSNVDEYNALYSSYDFANFFPGNPKNTGETVLTNNVYMMYNKENSFQSVKSDAFTLNANSYYELSFDFFNQNVIGNYNPSSIKVEVVDSNGIVLFSKDNISSLDRWNNYKIYFQTANNVSNNPQVIIHLGDENNTRSGIVYLDNFKIKTLTKEVFDTEKTLDTTVNLTNYYLNISEDGEVTNTVIPSPAYKESVDKTEADIAGDTAVTGIVKGNDNQYVSDFPELSIEDSNFLVIHSKYTSTVSLKSAFTLKTEADKYYKLSFDLATLFGDSVTEKDKEKNEYGVSVTIDGYNAVNYLKTENNLQKYSIYVKSTEEKTPTIQFTLTSNGAVALITRIDFSDVTEKEFKDIVLNDNYNQTIFSADKAKVEDDKDKEPETETKPEEDKDKGNNAWILVPSIITALAIIVGVVGYAFKHVKIKKINRIKKEAYDKKLIINHDKILVEAQKIRDKEYSDLQKAKERIEKEIQEIEENHKNYLSNTDTSNGKLTKEIEKELINYNYQIGKNKEKISIIGEKQDSTMSAEHLLAIEREIVSKEELEFNQEKKTYKQEKKQQRKNEKAALKLAKKNKSKKTK